VSEESVQRSTPCPANPGFGAETNRRRDRALAALYGGLLGAWWALCAIGFSYGTQRTWGIVPLDSHAGYQLFPLDRFVINVAQAYGFSFIGSLTSAALFLILLGLLGGFAVSAIGQLLRIDPQRLSRRALLDASGQLKNAMPWLALPLLLFLGLSLVYPYHQPAWLLPFAWLTGIMLVGVAPFLVLNRALLTNPDSRRWRISWPGWGPLLTATAVWTLFAAADLLAQLPPVVGGISAWLLVQPIRWILGAASSALLNAAWIDRQNLPGLWTWRKTALTRRTLGSFIALDVRLGIVWLWLLPLLVGISISQAYVFPQIVQLVEQQGGATPIMIRWLQVWGRNPLIPLLALAPLLAFMGGRLYVLLIPDRLGPDSEGSATWRSTTDRFSGHHGANTEVQTINAREQR
jgi:hypothetical protein